MISMIAVSVITAAALIVGTGLIVAFWNNIIAYLKETVKKVAEKIHDVVLGVKVFLRKTTDGVLQITKNYSQNKETEMWKETIVRRRLNEEEIPENLRSRVRLDSEFDITDQLELQLKNG